METCIEYVNTPDEEQLPIFFDVPSGNYFVDSSLYGVTYFNYPPSNTYTVCTKEINSQIENSEQLFYDVAVWGGIIFMLFYVIHISYELGRDILQPSRKK